MTSSIPSEVLAQYPALAPPPGVEPNLNIPESRAHSVIVASGVFTAILLIFVILRMYAKVFVSKSVGWEDAACVMGTIFSVGYVGLVSHVFHSGIGAHQWNVHLTVFFNETTVKELKATNFLSSPMMIFAKLSVLLLFFRLFATTKSFRNWIYFGIFTILLNHVGGVLLAVFLCLSSDPIVYAKCSEKTVILDVVISVINIISDFCILLLPLLVISQLRMNGRKKVGLCAVFMTGLDACISSVVGLIYRVVQWHSDDTSWWLGPLLVLSLLEVNMTLITGCMPLIPVIFKNNNLSLESFLSSRFFTLLSLRTKRSSNYESDDAPSKPISRENYVEMGNRNSKDKGFKAGDGDVV
ncbi:hypothetical protein HYALB_00006841 [Hymenoscyphus albidus]|uniref:Rhodopsin domain-containing protein n=1 Tax=Hymenoscyphus albidus TaxID=595503 RepID=A0A9N9PYF4_9HELO|nr:hypothetical protein HYALB_00006841 [Hymenoscyphus albidus]